MDVKVLIVLATVCIVACGDDDVADAAPDTQSDTAADLTTDQTTDQRVDAEGCPPVSCGDECIEYGRDGCAQCFCSSTPQCAVDADCALGNLAGTCCIGCPSAFSNAEIADNTCVVGRYQPTPQACAATDCSGPCPDVLCERPSRAVCDQGRCLPSPSCPNGEVAGPAGCVPRCADNSDCLLRVDNTGCCGGCPFVLHKDNAAKYACLIEEGATNPSGCEPSGCEEVDCPAIACDDITPVCNAEGICEAMFNL